VSSAVITRVRRPRLRNVFYKWFWDTYDNLGKVILGNVVWFILCLPTFFGLFGLLFQPSGKQLNLFPYLMLLIPSLLLSAPITAGLFHLTYIFVQEREAEFKELFIGFKKYFKKSVVIALILAAIIGLLVVNIQFYATRAPALKFIGVIFAGLGLWGMVFIGLLLVYLFPILVQQDGGLGKIFKRAALLVLDNIGYTLVVAILAMVVSLGLTIFTVGLVFLMMSLISILLNNALTEVLKKYEKREVKKEEKPAKPTSWKEIREKEEEEVEEEKPRRRGWRDIFRPWEM